MESEALQRLAMYDKLTWKLKPSSTIKPGILIYSDGLFKEKKSDVFWLNCYPRAKVVHSYSNTTTGRPCSSKVSFPSFHTALKRGHFYIKQKKEEFHASVTSTKATKLC